MTPAKGKGKEGNATRESRERSDDSDVEQPPKRFAAYDGAPPRPKPAPRPPSENAKAWAKDVMARVQAMAKHQRTHCQGCGPQVHLCMGCGPSFHPVQLRCSFTHMDICMFGCVCKDGMKMLHWKQWTQLQFVDVAMCLLLRAGWLPLLIERYIWNTVLFFHLL